MPALFIPASGFCEGTEPTHRDGLKILEAKNLDRRGFSNAASRRTDWTIVFNLVSSADVATILAQYDANRLTGGMTYTDLYGTARNHRYLAPPKVTPGRGLFSTVTLHLGD